jgi:type II secretory pathway pseudopilin PulG
MNNGRETARLRNPFEGFVMSYQVNQPSGEFKPAAGRRGGFTLVESAVVTAIIGFGVLAMLELLAAGTVSNTDGTELTTAINLANNIREIALDMDFFDPQDPATGAADDPKTWDTKEATLGGYDNVLDLDECAFNPPINAMRDSMAEYGSWTQVVHVESVPDENITGTLPADTPREATARVIVVVKRDGAEVYRTVFLAAAARALPD